MLYDKRWDTKIDTPVDEIGEILLKAADAIRKHGHVKHTRKDTETGSMCAHGAIGYAISGNPLGFVKSLECPAAARVHDYLQNKGVDMKRIGNGPYGIGYMNTDIATWNNLPETTAQDVIDALEGAARFVK